MAEAAAQEEHSKEEEQQQPEQPQEQPAADRQQKQTGVVKWFNATKGFGFITPDEGGEDLFVHQTCIDAEGFRSLREGEPVEFSIDVAEDGRTKAVKVTGPGGATPQGAPRRPPVLQAPYGGRGRGMARGYPMEGYGLPAEGFGMYHEGFAMHPAGYPPPPAMYPPPPGYAAPPAFMRVPRGGRGGGRLGGRYGGRGRGPPGERRPPPGTPGVSSGLQVVVHNLPWACTWQTLKDAFAGTGNIERADVIFDSTGRSRGFGTVRFSSPEEAEAAVELMNEKQIEGRTVTVRIDRFA